MIRKIVSMIFPPLPLLGALFCCNLFATSYADATVPIPLNLTTFPNEKALHPWPVMPPLPQPDGLRPCCAFGYNLHVNLFGIPLPLYQISNISHVDHTGHHHYNKSSFQSLLNIFRLGSEHNGLAYTQRGGFIDVAHVRDSADMTIYIFSHLWPKLGEAFTLTLSDELAQRKLIFNAFTPPEDPASRYTLAVYLSASLAFQVAAWHEVAQWYGFESVAGFSEGISAFSPEDLYSNLLGSRLAIILILSGHSVSLGMYDASMDTLINEALHQLNVVSPQQTRQQFDRLNHLWWNHNCSLPDKFLLLKRNYLTTDYRLPVAVPGIDDNKLQWLALPHQLYGYDFDKLAQLRLLPTKSMKKLPPPDGYYTAVDFPVLAVQAQQQDNETLQHLADNCR